MNQEEFEKEMYKLTDEFLNLCYVAKSEMLLSENEVEKIFKHICEIERIIVLPF